MQAGVEVEDAMNYGKRKAMPGAGGGGRQGGSRAPSLSGDPDDPEDGEKDTGKRKSRNLSEKKRRDQFNMLINELCSMVATNNRKMDKTTVLKTTIAFLKTNNEIAEQSQAHEIKEDWKPSFLSNDEFAQLMLEALDSFLLVVTQSGTILYASESVSALLHHLPSDLVNKSIFDYTHSDERMKIYEILSGHHVAHGLSELQDYEREENQVCFTCHLRCWNPSMDETPVYELVECCGNFRRWTNDGETSLGSDEDLFTEKQEPGTEVCFCCTVRIKSSQLIREMSTIDETKKEFTSRHSLEWKFLFLDHRGPPIIGYLPFEVLGTSGYDYYHPEDLDKVAKCHEQLMQSGEGTSCFYRFLTKGQQWLWLQTRYFITYHQWNSKPEFIVCTNTVVSIAEVRGKKQESAEHTENNSNGSEGSEVTSKRTSPKPECDGATSSSMWPSNTKLSLSPSASRSPRRPMRTESLASESDVVDTTDQSTPRQSRTNSICNVRTETQVRPDSQPAKHTKGNQGPGAFNGSMAQAAVSQAPFMATLAQQLCSIPSVHQVIDPITTLPMVTPTLHLTPAQRQLQEQLRQKHAQIQENIMRQQEELRQISEQLLLSSNLSDPSPSNVSSPSSAVEAHVGGALMVDSVNGYASASQMAAPDSMVSSPPAMSPMIPQDMPPFIPLPMLSQQQVLYTPSAVVTSTHNISHQPPHQHSNQ